MDRLDEYDVAESFVGKSVDMERLSEVFRENGYTYIAYCGSLTDNLYDKFGITPALYDRWLYGGVDFRVNLSLENGLITKCYIFKYKDTSGGGFGRPQGCEASPTQQEIRIFRRIMDYVVQG